MTLVKRIIQYFYRYEYPNKVRRAFFNWFIQSTHATEKEEVLSELWEEAHGYADHSTWQSLSEVSDKLGWTEEKQYIEKKDRIWRKRLLQAAAVLFLPVMTGFATWYMMRDTSPQDVLAKEISFVECFVANGELKTVVLPDSSRVIVNSGSILIYPEKMSGNERNVYLNGEAYFEVTQLPEQPFTVRTNGVEVKVLGTKFNVAAYSDQPAVTTTLEEGSVDVNIEGKKDLFRLSPKEQLSYNRLSGEITYSLVDPEYIAAWRQGDLVFLRSSIDEIVRTLEHRFNINIYLNSSAYEKEIITAKFVNGEDLQEALAVLKQLMPGFNYEIVKTPEGSGVNKVFIR